MSAGKAGALKKGTVIGKRFVIMSTLRADKVEAVYKGKDRQMKDKCVIYEIIVPDSSPTKLRDAALKFKKEASLLEQMDHPNLPEVRKFFAGKGRCYLVTDFFAGQSLQSILDKAEQPLPELKVVGWACQILDALDYLHTTDPPVYYLELKPRNILVGEPDDQIMLMYSNLTRKVLGKDKSGKLPIGNAGYAPSEQYKGYYAPTTDLYALAATMHHLLTGKKPKPFKFSSMREIRPEISIAIDTIIFQNALNKKPAARYQSAVQMMQAFAEIVHAPKDMILIPAGSFWMGSNTGEENEKPVHKIHLDSYYIDKCPITNAQFDKFTQETGYKGKGEWRKYYRPETADHPVVAVNWFEAIAYAEWSGKRLPTEAEWEKAARSNDMRKYPWGNKWDKNKCNTPDLDDPEVLKKRVDIYDGRGTTPAGSFPDGASPYGVLDMAGQVWEWCADWYDENYYGKLEKVAKITKNPKGPEQGEYRVLRGGSWGNLMGPCRCTCRAYSQKPDYINFNVGFRCVKDTATYAVT
ncbi:hypothetical protein C4588_02400 [Candidatus Parcubacteria bacterium]|nr:MAG: hypothetical protein C4588_02400 [Candidatus Parcubacteria bacterium]